MVEGRRYEEVVFRTKDTTYGKDYWDTLDSGHGYQRSTMWEDLAHSVKEVLGIENGKDVAGSKAVLDMGCAMGYLVEQLRRRGFEAWGLDISDYALENAPLEVAGYLHWYDMTSGNDTFFGNNRFDIILCFETLEHIPDGFPLHKALDSLFRSLRPNGIVLMTICTSEQPGWDTDPTHVNIQPRSWWLERMHQYIVSGKHFVHRMDLEDRFRQFWLFSQHHGVFVYQRTL
jgi:2-polyprenyl-3-methyl-5-hydroxy-6-metoxy-1,4-benzoquinol methylase